MIHLKTYRSQQFWSTDGRRVAQYNTWAEIEITNFNGTDLILWRAEDVLRFEVPMRYSLVVEELKGISDITNNKAGLVLCEVHPLLYVRQKWSAIHFLEYQIKSKRFQ